MHDTAVEKPQWKTDAPVISPIKNRWSRRAYSEKHIDQEVLDSIFEAARWAPSSMNEQPWMFLYGRKGSENWQKLFDTLMEGNQAWAHRAPVLILALAKKTFDRNGRPNRHYAHDLGAAVALLSTQATELGLNLHQMGGYHKDELERIFNVPEAWESFSIIALGYPGDPEILEEPFLSRELAPRSRKTLAEFVRTEAW
jgi:nitroreductase